jgi:hypothetical protein
MHETTASAIIQLISIQRRKCNKDKQLSSKKDFSFFPFFSALSPFSCVLFAKKNEGANLLTPSHQIILKPSEI